MAETPKPSNHRTRNVASIILFVIIIGAALTYGIWPRSNPKTTTTTTYNGPPPCRTWVGGICVDGDKYNVTQVEGTYSHQANLIGIGNSSDYLTLTIVHWQGGPAESFDVPYKIVHGDLRLGDVVRITYQTFAQKDWVYKMDNSTGLWVYQFSYQCNLGDYQNPFLGCGYDSFVFGHPISVTVIP